VYLSLIANRHVLLSDPWFIRSSKFYVLVIPCLIRQTALPDFGQLLLIRSPSYHHHRDDKSQQICDGFDDRDVPSSVLIIHEYPRSRNESNRGTYLHRTQLPEIQKTLHLLLDLIGSITTAISPKIFPISRHTIQPHGYSPCREMDKEKYVSNHAGNGICLVGGADTAAVRDERDEVHEEGDRRDSEKHERWPHCCGRYPWMDVSLD